MSAEKAFQAKWVNDCGVQHAGKEFDNFAESYSFEHGLASPKHPRANAWAETTVKAVTSPWKK